jgi:hypothetical protein
VTAVVVRATRLCFCYLRCTTTGRFGGLCSSRLGLRRLFGSLGRDLVIVSICFFKWLIIERLDGTFNFSTKSKFIILCHDYNTFFGLDDVKSCHVMIKGSQIGP